MWVGVYSNQDGKYAEFDGVSRIWRIREDIDPYLDEENCRKGRTLFISEKNVVCICVDHSEQPEVLQPVKE